MLATVGAVVFGMLAAFLAGAWVTYKAQRKQSPVPKFSTIIDGVGDLPDPVSPYEEAEKERRG